MNERLYWTLRSHVHMNWRDLTVGVFIHGLVLGITINPLPCVNFSFWFEKRPRRPVIDTVLEMMLIITTANILAFAVAAVIGFFSYRWEVMTLTQYIISQLPFAH